MIYKYYKDTSKHAVDNFLNDKICFMHVSKFNDSLEFNALFNENISLEHTPLKEEGQRILSAQINELKFRIRVFCASINGNNDHLWKNYANNSHGFCIGYDEREIKKQSNMIIMRKVEYSEEIPYLLHDDVKGSVINQIFHKSLNSDWPKEEEFRIALFLDKKDIITEWYHIENQSSNLNNQSDYITICSEYPINYLSKKNDELPIYERKTAPLYVFLHIKPKLLIIGKDCPKILKIELESIAKQKGIPIKNQGDKNV